MTYNSERFRIDLVSAHNDYWVVSTTGSGAMDRNRAFATCMINERSNRLDFVANLRKTKHFTIP